MENFVASTPYPAGSFTLPDLGGVENFVALTPDPARSCTLPDLDGVENFVASTPYPAGSFTLTDLGGVENFISLTPDPAKSFTLPDLGGDIIGGGVENFSGKGDETVIHVDISTLCDSQCLDLGISIDASTTFVNTADLVIKEPNGKQLLVCQIILRNQLLVLSHIRTLSFSAMRLFQAQ